MPDEPRFSVSEITTFHSTYEQDLVCYRKAGAQGIGIWEFKLPAGEDAESAAKLRDSGLKATTCIPDVLSIFPVPFPGPDDPDERTEALSAAIRRFAPFEPEEILCITGHPGDRYPGEARQTLVDGFRRAARVAADLGLTIGLEPLHREMFRHWTTVATIPEAIELIDEIGEPNVRLHYDVYHLWDCEDVLEHTRKYASRFAPSVHISDWRADTRSDFDRALPGDGVMDLPAIFGALEAGGFAGWFDLEIFSDDGSFTDRPLEGSLWQQDPLEVVRRAKEGFLRAWEARRVPA